MTSALRTSPGGKERNLGSWQDVAFILRGSPLGMCSCIIINYTITIKINSVINIIIVIIYLFITNKKIIIKKLARETRALTLQR